MDIRYILLLPLFLAGNVCAEQSLEDRLQSLEKQVKKTLSSSERVRFGGFLSTDIAYQTQDVGYASIPTDSAVDLSRGSVVGLQVDYKLTDKTGVGVQATARGFQNYEPEVMWAYVKHRFDMGLTVRAGRLGLPFFSYSDYIEVGYAQPWVRPPTEVYDIVPARSYTGIDFIYNLDMGWATARFQPFFGEITSNTRDNGFGTLNVPNTYGMNTSLFIDDFMIRGIFAKGNGASLTSYVDNSNNMIVVSPSGNITLGSFDSVNPWFAGVGVSYDDGEYMVISEAVRTLVTNTVFPSFDGAYLTFGYHIDDVTPYVTAARIRSTDDDVRVGTASSAFFDVERNAYSVGARWDVLLGLALKADVTYTNHFDGSNAGLNGVIGGATTADSALVYTVSMDVSF